ncbi:ABC transporter ATP-binding protein/permease [Patescibacteria group bacterium]|nr:ABC transporter ATP-binding protein/permease [Patescibacteria group bacterium]
MAKTNSPQNTIHLILWILHLVYRIIPVIVVCSLIFQALAAVAPFATNYYYAQIIDSLIRSSQVRQNLWVSPFIAFLLVRTGITLITHVNRTLQRVSDYHIDIKLRQLYVKKISELDYQHFDDKQTSNLIAKVNDEYLWRTRQALSDILQLFSSLFSFGATIVIIFDRYWYLGVLLLVTQIPGFLLDKKWSHLGWLIHHHNIEKMRIGNEIHRQLIDKRFLSELKINQSVDFLFTKFKNIYDSILSERLVLRQNKQPYDFLAIATDNLVLFACLFVIIHDILAGRITVGLFTFYFSAMRSTGDYFSAFFNSFVSLTEQSMYLEDLKKVFNLKNFITNGQKHLQISGPPQIEFKNVSFHYPESTRFVFKNLNLTINAGEEIALVGENGAGKTTLIKLLCRFYDPTEGQILINGHDLRTFDRESWYQYLSILFQEFTTYPNLTLKENIAIGHHTKESTSQIKEALKLSEAADFASHYEKGLESFMGQKFGGEEPSWGQWQKIAIARVFYRDTPIMILDEPTASIDAISEAKIFSRLYLQSRHKTLIIVSHRFSTVRNAQRIIVLSKGQITEEGSHKDLVNLRGLYAHSYQLQASGYQEN